MWVVIINNFAIAKHMLISISCLERNLRARNVGFSALSRGRAQVIIAVKGAASHLENHFIKFFLPF